MYHILKRAIEIIRKEGMILFTKLLLKFIIDFFCLPYCAFRIKHFTSWDDLYKSVDFSFSICNGLIKPVQDRAEILTLLAILKKVKPVYVLEIGTAFGGTLFLFTRIASEYTHIISVDIGGWGVRGGYPDWKKAFYKSFALPNQEVHLLKMDSHAAATLEKVESILDGKKLDFVFIDGDHTYEGVKKDFEMYAPLVVGKGLIAFHDIISSSLGVNKFWNEVKSRYDYKEIGTREGIGLILIDKNERIFTKY